MALSRFNRPCNSLIFSFRLPYAVLNRSEQRPLTIPPSGKNLGTSRSFNILYNQPFKYNISISKSAQASQEKCMSTLFVEQKTSGGQNANGRDNSLLQNARYNRLVYRELHVKSPLWANDKQSDNLQAEKVDSKVVTKRQALRMALVKYGPIILIFHISHSLVLLGITYLLVKSGVDMYPFAEKLFPEDADNLKQVMYTSSTFVIAYTMYKLTAPVRIGITLVAFPYLMKFLRRLGFRITPPPRPTVGNKPTQNGEKK